MITTLQLILLPEQASSQELIKKAAATSLKLQEQHIYDIRIVKKSIDARSRQPKVLLSLQIFIDENAPEANYEKPVYQNVADKPSVIIVGAGPAGLFAALTLLEKGLKPIIIERGKEVSERKVDIAQLNRNNGINTESNYCFGEGGAGTFSDGKLFSRSKKRGDMQRVLEIFHFHGANDNILYEAHPHIGSNKLPQIIKHMRETILQHGGEIHFNAKLSELIIENNAVCGCRTADGRTFSSNKLILAIGHSAHDTYRLLHQQGVRMESKGFAMGVRVEHPQSLIDSIQYHSKERSNFLPAAAYSLVAQVNGRGVYSFCMCPGGHIVPASSQDGLLVVNGMSTSQRNSPFANSGIVVEIRPEDIPAQFQKYGQLAGLEFQEYVEHLCYQNNAGQGAKAPAQRLMDFVKGRLSANLPECSYQPGLVSSPLHAWLPEQIGARLREGFTVFDKKMRGYLTNQAVVVGVESRSSSPLRIPRNAETYQHIDISGLYPCGEGAGYAGGITSSAMDGIKCTEQIDTL